MKNCEYSGKTKVIKICGKPATYEVDSLMGKKYYCTRHANLRRENILCYKFTKLLSTNQVKGK